jgi:putative membrane protein
MTRKMLWASALVLPLLATAPVLAQPAAGPPGSATVPAEKIAPMNPTNPAGNAMAPSVMPPTAAANLSASDKAFVEKAAEGGMTEVAAAKAALDKTTNPTVKEFAQKMVTDHTANNEQLKTLAMKKNVTVPDDLDAKDQAMLTKMQALSGAKFDKAYMKAQVADHTKMLKLMDMEAKKGQDPDLKSFAASTATVVQQHLDMAKQDTTTIASAK